jgi:Leucine-rich repeat (LRR) protein
MKKLDLMGNNLRNLPRELGNLVNLNVLDVRNNKLSLENLPAEIGRLVNLKKLFFSNNILSALPPEIGNMQGLKVLLPRSLFISTTR